MRVEELRKVHRRIPFAPFRITLENGESYRVAHPEQLMITDVLCFWGCRKKWALFAPQEITSVLSLEDLDASAGDGSKRRR